MQDAEDGIGDTEEGDGEEDLEEGGKIERLCMCGWGEGERVKTMGEWTHGSKLGSCLCLSCIDAKQAKHVPLWWCGPPFGVGVGLPSGELA